MKSFEWVFAANARSSDHRRRTDYRPSTALVHDVIHSMPNKIFFSFEPGNGPDFFYMALSGMTSCTRAVDGL